MLLVADSGSSKTDWLICDDFGSVKAFQTSGINPFFRTSDDIVEELTAVFEVGKYPIAKAYFYGAGVVNVEKAKVIEQALKRVFGDGLYCEIASDVLGAARAVCGHEAGIACILGTGANACYFDGRAVQDSIPPMGYILGDEGSGAVIGRQLLGDYFKGMMPAEIQQKFQSQYQLDKDDVLNRVYRMEKPNKYLASFTRFLKEQEDSEYARELLKGQFKAFIQRNVLQLSQSRSVPVSFVGSIAYHFQNLLKKELDDAGLTVGQIVQGPIDSLLEYHRKEL